MSRKSREQRIRERAYFLWQQSNCPQGKELDFWIQASELEPRSLWLPRLQMWLVSKKDALATIQAAATTLALIVGGLWTYQIFILERDLTPHVDISQVVTGKLISSKWYWIRSSITAENTGKSLVRPKTEYITVVQITPLPRAIYKELKDNMDPIPYGSGTFHTKWRMPWQGLCQYIISLKNKIEPNESDTQDVDFVVPSWLKTVGVYTFIQNNSDKNGLGWHAFTVYNLKGSGNYEHKGGGEDVRENRRLCAYEQHRRQQLIDR